MAMLARTQKDDHTGWVNENRAMMLDRWPGTVATAGDVAQ